MLHVVLGLLAVALSGVSSGVTVVFSDELAKPASLALTQQQYKKSYFGTCSYIPALFGLYIASHIIRHAVDNTYQHLPWHQAFKAADSCNAKGQAHGRASKAAAAAPTAMRQILPLPAQIRQALVAVLHQVLWKLLQWYKWRPQDAVTATAAAGNSLPAAL
jgi:hypothetical protein